MFRIHAKYLIALLLYFPAAAHSTFFFVGEGKFRTLTKEISYRVDDSKVADVEKIIADPFGWLPQEVTPFKGTQGPATVWAKFDLPDTTVNRRILLDTSPWERVDFFAVHDGRIVDQQTTGALVPWAERTTQITMNPAIFHSGFVEVDWPAQSHTRVYARLETQSRFYEIPWLRFYLWDASQVNNAVLHDRMVQGLFYGVMLFLIVYNLGLYVVTREPSFIFYVIMELGYVVGWSVIFGLTFEFLWPGRPEWDYHALWIATIVGGCGLVQFLRYYLETWKQFPLMDTLLKWQAYLSLLMIPLVFLPLDYGALAKILIFAIPLGVVIFLLVIIRALIHHHPLARNLLIAMLCFFAGTIVFFFQELGLVPTVDLTIHAAQIGSALAGIVLSIGLGLRWQHTRMEMANLQLEEERTRNVHEREKRELVEEHSRGLEAKVEERTAELVASQRQSDVLLANILPRAIIDELKANGVSEPRRHEEASILFTDFAGFTQAVSTIPPKRLVQELDEIFRGFDDIVATHGLEKIKTIGDAYMTASGLPVASADHAVRTVRAGLALTRFIEERNKTAAMKWGLRVGVHSGAVVAGIVGKNKYAYDVWGDTVNIASRLESAGEPNKVNISAYTYELVRDCFECEYRGKLAAKGKGEIDMYFVLRECVAAAAGTSGA